MTRLASLLPATAAGRRLLLVFLIDPFGTGLFISGSAVFFTQHVGLSAGQVSLGLSVSALTGLACTVPIGVLADRYGVRRVQVALHLWRATGFLLYTQIDSFPVFLAVAAMIGIGDRCSPPLNQALVGLAVEPEDRVRTMGLLRAAKNLAFVLGGLAAVALIGMGSAAAYDALVVVDAATFVVAAVVVARLPLLRPDRRRVDGLKVRVPALADRRYLGVAAAHGVLGLHSSLLVVGVPLFALERTGTPEAAVGAFFVVNSAMVTLGQVRMTRGAESLAGAVAATMRAGRWLVAACAGGALAAVLGGSGAAAAALFACVVLLSVGEMLQSAGGWGMSFELADPDRQGEYLSVFSLGATLEAVVGPALVTALVVHGGVAGWAGLGVAFLASAVASRVLARPALRPAPLGVVP